MAPRRNGWRGEQAQGWCHRWYNSRLTPLLVTYGTQSMRVRAWPVTSTLLGPLSGETTWCGRVGSRHEDPRKRDRTINRPDRWTREEGAGQPSVREVVEALYEWVACH